MCSCVPVLCANTETAETTFITQPLLYVGKQKWKFSLQIWMKKIWRFYWHGWNSDSVWRRWRRRRRGISLACTESLKQIALSRPLHCRFLWRFPSIKHQLPHEVLDETLGQRVLGLDQPKSPPLLPKSLRKRNCRRFVTAIEHTGSDVNTHKSTSGGQYGVCSMFVYSFLQLSHARSWLFVLTRWILVKLFILGNRIRYFISGLYVIRRTLNPSNFNREKEGVLPGNQNWNVITRKTL